MQGWSIGLDNVTTTATNNIVYWNFGSASAQWQPATAWQSAPAQVEPDDPDPVAWLRRRVREVEWR